MDASWVFYLALKKLRKWQLSNQAVRRFMSQLFLNRGKTLEDLPVKRIYSFRDLKDVLVSDWKFTASMLDSDAWLGMFGTIFGGSKNVSLGLLVVIISIENTSCNNWFSGDMLVFAGVRCTPTRQWRRDPWWCSIAMLVFWSVGEMIQTNFLPMVWNLPTSSASWIFLHGDFESFWTLKLYVVFFKCFFDVALAVKRQV